MIAVINRCISVKAVLRFYLDGDPHFDGFVYVDVCDLHVPRRRDVKKPFNGQNLCSIDPVAKMCRFFDKKLNRISELMIADH